MDTNKKFFAPLFREKRIEESLDDFQPIIEIGELRTFFSGELKSYFSFFKSPAFPRSIGKGKGLSKEESIVGAVAESMERGFYSVFSEKKELAAVFDETCQALGVKKIEIDPSEDVIVSTVPFTDRSGTTRHLIKDVVNYSRGTNTMALGASKEEAYLYSLLEASERFFSTRLSGDFSFSDEKSALDFLGALGLRELTDGLVYARDFFLSVEKIGKYLHACRVALRAPRDSEFFVVSTGVSFSVREAFRRAWTELSHSLFSPAFDTFSKMVTVDPELAEAIGKNSLVPSVSEKNFHLGHECSFDEEISEIPLEEAVSDCLDLFAQVGCADFWSSIHEVGFSSYYFCHLYHPLMSLYFSPLEALLLSLIQHRVFIRSFIEISRKHTLITGILIEFYLTFQDRLSKADRAELLELIDARYQGLAGILEEQGDVDPNTIESWTKALLSKENPLGKGIFKSGSLQKIIFFLPKVLGVKYEDLFD